MHLDIPYTVHSKASNIGCWGDSGRYPLFFESLKLAIDYFERAEDSYENSDDSLLAASFSVQKDLGLDWHSNLSKLTERFHDSRSSCTRKSTPLTECLRQEFVKPISRKFKKFTL